jgi:large subunit ribosomal protein L35
MPKLKTHSSAKKRFKVTGSGKIKRTQAGKRHILTKKEKSRKLKLGQPALVHKTEFKRVRRLLAIGG